MGLEKLSTVQGACNVPQRVLITGVYGVVGNATYARLQTQPAAYQVYGLDRERAFSARVAPGQGLDVPAARFYQADLQDRDALARAVEAQDAVVHLAADPEGRSWESVLHNNIMGAYHVFEACRAAGVKRVVAASSYLVSEGHRQHAGVYQDISAGRYADVPEDFPRITVRTYPEPRSLYASSKVWLEALAQTYQTHYACFCLRIGTCSATPVPVTWCSPRDAAQLVECCLNAPAEPRCEVLYGFSRNRWCWLDIEETRRKVGYVPQDSYEEATQT
jgi:uronate dehydrogenase